MKRRLVPVVLVLLAVSGCGGHLDSSDMISGPPPRVQGRLEGVGGPAGTSPGHWPGTVTLTADDGEASTVHTYHHGRFDVAVLGGPGHYKLTGHSPRYGDGKYLCHGVRTIEVHEHQTVHVNVLCQMK